MAREVTRYFVNCTAPTPTESHEAAAQHGRVLAVKVHRGNQPSGDAEWVYGWAEIELKEESDAHSDS